MKPRVLYFIRSEADLERITSIAIPGKKYAEQFFVYYGDMGIVFEEGIKNKFQKYLLDSHGFKVLDGVTVSIPGKVYKIISKLSVDRQLFKILKKLVLKTLFKIIYLTQENLAQKLIRKINPSILIMDNAEERPNYFPHYLRQAAIDRNLKVHITGHGPAGGLHKEYHSYEMIKPDLLTNCIVGICSEHDYGYGMDNRIITGDPADSFPHLLFKHSLDYGAINFHNERKYKIGFFMASPFETSTNGWSVMEEIMLDLSFNKDVAMVAKLHPRLYKHGDFRYLLKINNLKLFGSELDRTRIVKWADIIICSDHCSTLFEPMIFGKKVVAVHSKKSTPFANHISPIHQSDPTMNSIHHSSEFQFDELKNYTPDHNFIDEYCWGRNGKIDLGEKIIKDLITPF